MPTKRNNSSNKIESNVRNDRCTPDNVSLHVPARLHKYYRFRSKYICFFPCSIPTLYIDISIEVYNKFWSINLKFLLIFGINEKREINWIDFSEKIIAAADFFFILHLYELLISIAKVIQNNITTNWKIPNCYIFPWTNLCFFKNFYLKTIFHSSTPMIWMIHVIAVSHLKWGESLNKFCLQSKSKEENIQEITENKFREIKWVSIKIYKIPCSQTPCLLFFQRNRSFLKHPIGKMSGYVVHLRSYRREVITQVPLQVRSYTPLLGT